ncbi:MAG: zf-TFIIB domain-containing protein [Candidatus Wallbacteria bacterium]
MHELKCPKCDVKFTTEKISGITIQSCKKCGAVFVDGIEVLRLREGATALESGQLDELLQLKNVNDNNYINEKCPHCNMFFHDEEYIQNSGIHFKLCTKCSSIMFDQPNITKLKNFEICHNLKIYDEFEELFPVMKRVIAK